MCIRVCVNKILKHFMVFLNENILKKNAMSYQHSIIYLLNNQSLNQSISGTLWCLLYMFSACHVFFLTSVKIYLCIILDKCSLSLQWRCCTVFSGHISQFCRNALTKHSKYCSLSATYFPTLTLSSINLCFPWMRKDRMSRIFLKVWVLMNLQETPAAWAEGQRRIGEERAYEGWWF